MDTQMINFAIPKPLLQQVDSAAKKSARGRSEFLREAIRQFLREENERTQIFALMNKTAASAKVPENTAMQLVEEAKQWARRKSK